MRTYQQHINLIREKFAALHTKEDVVLLLNEAKDILYHKKGKPLSLQSLNYYSDPALCKKRYARFGVKKKSGGERIIHSPVRGLKLILRSLNFVLQCISEPHNAATGFVPEKSIADNAKVHVGNTYVFNTDLKDFFHSFDKKWVKYGFMIPPFTLGKEREELAFFLASLCTHPFEIDGKNINALPQGSPTSPTITNILCQKLDRRLSGLASRFGARYTRYADDITFSCMYNIFDRAEKPKLNKGGKYDDFISELERIITEYHLKINPEKTRLNHKTCRQEVTGLVVNEKPNVKRTYIKQIRLWLHLWERYGYEKAEQIFIKDYKLEKGHVKKGKPNLANVLAGKLEFLKMVKGENDSTYLKLKERFDKLGKKSNILSMILDIWECEGIERAMEVFNDKIVKK